MSSETASSPSRARRLLIPLGTMLAAGAVIVGSGADFTSTTSSAPSVVTAGDFTQENTAEGAALFTLEGVAPGESVTGTATVTNTGDFDGDFTLVEEDDTTTFPDGDLKLVVTDVTNSEEASVVYEGDLGGLESESLGTIAPDASRTYEFVVTFDAAAGDDAQGSTASAVYTWNAVQSD